MTRSGLAEGWDDYVVQVRQDAHQLLAWGYVDTRSEICGARDEYDITGLLARGIDERLNSPQTPERYQHYAVHNERPTSPSGERGKERPRLDIEIEHCGPRRPRPRFTFEAKRLRDDAKSSIGDTVRHYFGADGVLRFVKGHYAPESREAAMLGCVQAHDSAFWFAQVGKELDSDFSGQEPQYALTGLLEKVSVIPDFPDERVSTHERASGFSVRIFHVFIDCRREAASQSSLSN